MYANKFTNLIPILEQCATATNEWAAQNNVEFDIGKTEAVVFSRKRDQPDRRAARIQVGTTEVGFNMNATRWLGVWLDSKLDFREHHNRCMKKARAVEGQIRRLSGPRGMTPTHVRQVQVATAQAVAL